MLNAVSILKLYRSLQNVIKKLALAQILAAEN